MATELDAGAAPARSPRRSKKSSWIPTLRRQNSKRMQQVLENVPETNVGVCLSSNGGYHGVAFCAGALKSMLESRLRIDHLSTVSSGSVVGAAYMDWKVREGGVDHPEWHGRFFRQLRDSLDATARASRPDAAGAAATLLTTLVHVGGTLLLLCGLCFPLLRVHQMHVSWINGLSALHTSAPLQPGLLALTDEEPLTSVLFLQVFAIGMLLLRSRFGRNQNLSVARHFVFIFMSMLPLMIYVSTTSVLLEEGERLRVVFGDACRDLLANGTNSSAATARTALDPSNPYGCNFLARLIHVAVPGVAFLIQVFVLALFLGTHRSLLVTLTSFSLNLILLGQKPFVVGGSDGCSAWSVALTYTGMVAFFALPFILPLHQNATVRQFEESLRHSFFHPSKKNPDFHTFRRNVLGMIFKSCHRAPLKDDTHQRRTSGLPRDDLTFGDLAHVKPEFIIQMSLLNWQNTSRSDDSVKLLSVSSKMVDVIYRRERDDVSAYLDVVPTIVPLSRAMATSFLNVSMIFTSVRESFKLMREMFFLLIPQSSLRLPVWSDPALTLRGSVFKIALIFFIHVGIALDSALFLLLGDVPWKFVPELCFLFRVGLLFVVLFPSDKSVVHASALQQIFFMMSRWLNVNIPLCQFVRSMSCATTEGEFPDFILEIGSSAHLEHTGLMALLKRNTSRIIIVDAGAPHGVNRAERIMDTLQRSRKNFGCRFSTTDGEDLTYELFRTMGSSTRGVAPHAFQFKVHYTAASGEGRVVTGEGDIVLLQPRHPDRLQDGEWSGDLRDGWCAEEADDLFGTFTSDSRQWMSRSMAEAYHGKFPYYDRAFYPTPEQTDAMFREGERVMSAPRVREFVGESPRMPGVGLHRSTDSLSSLPEEMEDSTPSPSSCEDDIKDTKAEDETLDMSELGLHFQLTKDSLTRMRRRKPIAEISPVDDQGRALASAAATKPAAVSPPPPALPPRPLRGGRSRESFTPLESPVDVPPRTHDKPTPGDARNALTRVAFAVPECDDNDDTDDAKPPPLPPKPKMNE